MAAFPHIPRQGRQGGGAALLNDLQSGALGWATPWLTFGWGYKLKVTGSGFWDAGSVTALASATSQVITLGTTFPGTALPPNVIIEGVDIRIVTAFAGVTTPTLEVGDTGNDDEWVNAFALDGTAGYYNDVADATAVAAEEGAPIVESGYAPLATLGTGGGNIDTLTAGEVDIIFRLRPAHPALLYGQP